MHYHQQEIETDHLRRETAVYVKAIATVESRIEAIRGKPEIIHGSLLARKAYDLGLFESVRIIYRHLLSVRADLVN